MSICKTEKLFDTFIVISSSKNTSEKEINELKKHKLPILFLDVPEAYYDEVGGYHNCAEGWNPNGVWCGECTNKSCAKCPSKDVKEEDRNGKLSQR